jgi:hypothetical protein
MFSLFKRSASTDDFASVMWEGARDWPAKHGAALREDFDGSFDRSIDEVLDEMVYFLAFVHRLRHVVSVGEESADSKFCQEHIHGTSSEIRRGAPLPTDSVRRVARRRFDMDATQRRRCTRAFDKFEASI